MKQRPIQTSFAVGEISPIVQGRFDTEVYQQAVAGLENVIPLAQGPLRGRRGGYHITNAKNTDAEVRLISFSLGRAKDYCLELGNLYLRIHDTNGPIQTSPNEFKDPYFQTTIGDIWLDTGSTGDATVTLNPTLMRAELYAGGADEAHMRQTIVHDAGDFGVLHNLEFTIAGEVDVQVQIGIVGNETKYFDSNLAAGDHVVPYTPLEDNTLIQFKNLTGGGSTAYVFNVNHYNPAGSVLEFVTKWTTEQLEDIQFDFVAALDTMILVHENVAIAKLTRTSHSAWTFQHEDVTPFLTSPPAQWTGTNWPQAVAVYDGRLYFGGTPNEGTRLNGSKAGSYFDFTPPAGSPVAADPIDVTMAYKGRIQWLRGQRGFLLGTELAEYLVDAPSTGIIAPTDISIKPHSAYGSSHVQAVNIGDQVLYVGPDARKVRAADYSHEKQGWVSMDITWFANHITRAGIKYMEFASDPLNLIACVMRDGSMVTCTYDRNVDSKGWAPHTVTGTVYSACSTAGVNGSLIWTATLLENGNVSIAATLPSMVVNYPAMDQAVLRPVLHKANGDPYVDGLDYLDDMDVVVLLDGAVHPGRKVAFDATYGYIIDLQNDGDMVAVGVPFRQKVRFLPFEKGAPDGVMTAYKQRWNKLFLFVEESANPIINGERPPERDPFTPMDTPEPPKTGLLQVTTLGWDRLRQLEVEQDLPLPLTILAVFGELTTKGN